MVWLAKKARLTKIGYLDFLTATKKASFLVTADFPLEIFALRAAKKILSRTFQRTPFLVPLTQSYQRSWEVDLFF